MKTGDNAAVTLKEIRRGSRGQTWSDLFTRDPEERPTATQSHEHEIPSIPNNTPIITAANDKTKTDTQAQPRPISLDDIEANLENLFLDMPMLLQAVKHTGGLQQFRESLTKPSAMQVFNGFLTRLTGQKQDSTVDGRYREKHRQGNKWDYWVVKYRDQL